MAWLIAVVPPQASGKADVSEPSWKDLGAALPQPVDQADRDDLLWQQFEAHFRWYHRAATRTRLGYQGLRLVVIIAGAAVTVLAARDAEPWLTATLGAVIVVAEGIQQLFQFHANWNSYRSSAETLRQHGMLYAARAEPYDGQDRRVKLGNLLRQVVSKESGDWVSRMREPVAGSTTTAP